MFLILMTRRSYKLCSYKKKECTNKMRKTNAWYLKTHKFIAETHRDTEGQTETHR